MYYIGLMSGTSMDAVDAALVEFENKAKLKFYREYPIEESLKLKVRQVNEKTELNSIAELDHELGHLFAKAVNRVLTETNIEPEQVNAIGSHGQTVLHKPDSTHNTSIQIGDPNIICAETGITTVADFRRMDMAHGGQGAPLASAFHQYQFQQEKTSLVILNIGGIANITLLPAKKEMVTGFDTGPGNGLLDDWTQLNNNKPFDKDGQWASTGKVNDALLKQLLKDDYFSQAPPKSTGREYFNLTWLNNYLKQQGTHTPVEDIQATLLKLSAQTISDAINTYANDYDDVLVCGGGAHNALLLNTLVESLSNIKVTTTADYGLIPDCIEAVTFAWLAKQRMEIKTANLPDVTGARTNVILGGIYSRN